LAALATVTLHGEYGHGMPPLVAATLSIVVGWIAWRKRLPPETDSPRSHRLRNPDRGGFGTAPKAIQTPARSRVP
jgi:hypothetical protein